MVGGGQRGIGVAAPHGRVRDGACATVGAGSNLQTALRGDAMRCDAMRCAGATDAGTPLRVLLCRAHVAVMCAPV